MDLSVNNILNNKKIHFKGLQGAYDKDTVPVFKFLAPPHSKEETVFLEVGLVDKNELTGQYNPPEESSLFEFNKEDDTFELSQEGVRGLSSGFAYRYVIVGKDGKTRYEIDPFKKMEFKADGKEVKMNVIEQGRMYGISPKGGTMRHSFLDSDVRFDEKTGKMLEVNKEFVRNHFNKLGGSVRGLLYLLKNTHELDSYRYIMTTPDIGADKVSSHKYWPSNQYQCTDLETFKDFNCEMFKQGKGYIADGAFTSQGIQSPLVQHVLKWGKESPFYDMLKIDGAITLGVLPDTSEIDGVNPHDHIGVRLVNGKGPNYDKNKPTYIQFYDDRLLSKECQTDGKLHFDYDSAPDDHYEITSHQDSIQPYAFEIDPNDKKLKAFRGSNAILLNDLKKNVNINNFLTFPNFTIGTKNGVSGVTTWDGNVDIIKMNLSNPNSLNPKNVEGSKNAREYLFGVASYWTNLVESALILDTAKADDKNKEAVANANNISTKRFGEIITSIKAGDFNSHTLNEVSDPNYLENFIKSFPLQSIEASDELSAIFAQPQFQKEFFNDTTYQKVKDIFDSTVSAAIPDKYKNDEQYRAYVIKTYGVEILRHIFASALNPQAIDNNGTINTKKLGEVTLKSIEKYHSTSPEDERRQVISKLRQGINSDNLNSLQKRMKQELKEISLDNFKLAEAIVLQGRGGLNWRFDAAKDIGDLDAVRNGKKSFYEIWSDVQSFFGEFITRIRRYHPASYVINEVTSLNDFCDKEDAKSMEHFNPQLANYYNNLTVDKGDYENEPYYQIQVQYLDETNSTTTSEFAHGFNDFSKFAGVDPESMVDGSSNGSRAGNLTEIKKVMEKLMKYNQPNSAIYSHMFTNNHDKPSVLHTLPLNMSVFLAKDLKNLPEDKKKDITELTGGRIDYDNISQKAAGVGLKMSEVIDALYDKESDEGKALKQALKLLVNGQKTTDSKYSFKRAESFGVKPFEITIRDLFKYAKKYSKNFQYSEQDVIDFRYEMMKDAMTRYQRVWQVMNACVGTPTLFGGNEYASTGYETSSKNVYVAIRNQVEHDIIKKHSGFKEYYDRITATSGLYRKQGLSALRDGCPTSFEMITEEGGLDKTSIANVAAKLKIDSEKLEYFINQIAGYISGQDSETAQGVFDYLNKLDDNKYTEFLSKELGIDSGFQNHEVFKNIFKIEKNNNGQVKQNINDVVGLINEFLAPKTQIWPVYKKDDSGSQTLSIITNLGIPQGKLSSRKDALAPSDNDLKYETHSIKLETKEGACPIEGTKFYRMVYKNGQYVTETIQNTNVPVTYIVKNGELRLNDSTGNSPITLDDTVTTFYAVKEQKAS